MNQEKAKKFLAEIEEWMNNLDLLLNVNNNNVLAASSVDSPSSPDYEGSRLVESLASLNLTQDSQQDLNDKTHLSIKHLPVAETNETTSVKRPGSGIIVAVDESMANNLKIKQLNTIKHIHVSIAQLRSLCEMFEKRQEQLKKIINPQPTGVVKPIQRVEPQVIMRHSGDQASSDDSSSIDVSLTTIFSTSFRLTI